MTKMKDKTPAQLKKVAKKYAAAAEEGNEFAQKKLAKAEKYYTKATGEELKLNKKSTNNDYKNNLETQIVDLSKQAAEGDLNAAVELGKKQAAHKKYYGVEYNPAKIDNKIDAAFTAAYQSDLTGDELKAAEKKYQTLTAKKGAVYNKQTEHLATFGEGTMHTATLSTGLGAAAGSVVADAVAGTSTAIGGMVSNPDNNGFQINYDTAYECASKLSAAAEQVQAAWADIQKQVQSILETNWIGDAANVYLQRLQEKTSNVNSLVGFLNSMSSTYGNIATIAQETSERVTLASRG